MKSNTPRGWNELVWSHAGSGCSTVIPKPAWQTDTGCKMKTVADLSAAAENISNYCTDPGGRGGWGTVGGTSASSPFIAGALAVTGVLDGHFNPSWVWQHLDAFFDITSGNNGTCGGSPAYYCQATAGYDAPTGVGTPNGDALTGGAPDAGRPGDAGVADATRDGAHDASGSAGSGGVGGGATGAGGSDGGTTGFGGAAGVGVGTGGSSAD